MSADSDSLVRRFDRDGYVLLAELFPEARLREIEARLERYMVEHAAGLPAGDIVYEADGRAVRNLWRMEAHDPWFAVLAQDPALVGLATALLGAPAVSQGVELFGKPPRIGSGVPYHQDNAYFNRVPPEVLTIWLALDASTPENGCVAFVPGSHRWTPLPHAPSGVAGNSQGALLSGEEALEERAAPVPRGGASVHHCLTLHRSDPNRSERSRRALLFVYRSERAREDPEGAARYRTELARALGGAAS